MSWITCEVVIIMNGLLQEGNTIKMKDGGTGKNR